MPALKPLEIGVMFWAEAEDPVVTLQRVKSTGVRCGQMGLPGSMPLAGLDQAWKTALEAEQFTIVTVFASFTGESYADIPTVERTVGFIPHATREERLHRMLALSDFAAALGVGSIACHVGFIPPDRSHPDYGAVRDIVREIADYAARHGQIFALETGQEPAEVLLRFIHDVGCNNVKINFDPANMILYGTGDPIAAFKTLAPFVVSVHAKDGDWPPANKPGALGTERPLGQGSVGIERFIAALQEAGYTGTLNVEREIEDQDQKWRDVAAAVRLLRQLTAETA